MPVTKESDNNMQDYNITSIWERNQLSLINEERVYNLCLSVDILFNKTNILSPIDQTFLPQALLTN